MTKSSKAKLEYMAEYQKRPENVDKRVERNRARREAIREGVVFALPPHKGDTFIPGQLSQALLNAQLTPIVDHIAHAPALPSDDRYDQGGYAEVVVTCTSRDVPSDHLLEQLRNEGWKVHDFRAQAQRRRDGKTF